MLDYILFSMLLVYTHIITFKMTSVIAESRGALELTVTENDGGNKVVDAMEITGLEDIYGQ